MDRNGIRPARRSPTVGLFFAILLPTAFGRECAARDPLPAPRFEQPEPLPLPDEDGPPESTGSDVTPVPDDPKSWGELLLELSEEFILRDFEVRRDWGDTTEVFAGFNVRTRGGIPRVSKRTRRVNHGLWRRFRVEVVRPADRLRIELRNLRLAEEGGLVGEVVLTARLRCTADAVSWNYGVRGPATTVLTDLTLRAVSDWRLFLRNDSSHSWIPDYRVVPEVRGVRLRILDFDVRRVGLIGGELADELGDASREIVEELLERQQPRIVRRLQHETGQMTVSVDQAAPADTTTRD